MARAKHKGILHKHAQRRALERLNMYISFDEFERLEAQIQTQNAIFVKRQSLTRTHWYVQYGGGIWLRVVYDTIRHAIVTVLWQRTNKQIECIKRDLRA